MDGLKSFIVYKIKDTNQMMKNKLIVIILILLLSMSMFAKTTPNTNAIKHDRKYANIVLNKTFKFNHIDNISKNIQDSLDTAITEANDIARISYAGFKGEVYAKSSDGLIYGIKLTREFKNKNEMNKIITSLQKKYKQISKKTTKKTLSKKECQNIFLQSPAYALLKYAVVSNWATEVEKEEAQKAINKMLETTTSNTITKTVFVFKNNGDEIKVTSITQSSKPKAGLSIIYLSKEILKEIAQKKELKKTAEKEKQDKINQEIKGL